MVEALAELKRRQGEIDMLRATKPSRFGWTVGAGLGLGYDFQYQRTDVEPFIGVIYGIRF